MGNKKGTFGVVREAIEQARKKNYLLREALALTKAQKPHPDDIAVDQFASAMKEKLQVAREKKGRGGWQQCSTPDLVKMMIDHIAKGDMRDVANFAMMIWHNENGAAVHINTLDELTAANALVETLRSRCKTQLDTAPGIVASARADAPDKRQVAEGYSELENKLSCDAVHCFSCMPKPVRNLWLDQHAWLFDFKQDEELQQLRARVTELEAALREARETLDGEPDYHDQGMGCGLEDRNITDRYAAMAYGWNEAIERVYGEYINAATEIIDAALAQKGSEQ